VIETTRTRRPKPRTLALAAAMVVLLAAVGTLGAC
jgi:hypothetical protein